MTRRDLMDEQAPVSGQIVVDTSILLALRDADDNPEAKAARDFMRRLRQQIEGLQVVAWLPLPVLQECYHIILSRSLRRVWETLPEQGRPANWLAAYKRNPELLARGFADLAVFDQIIASIPLTPVEPSDLADSPVDAPLGERMRYFVIKYHLMPQDALILATAEALGATAVVTLDRDWRRVDEFNVYTTTN